MEWCHDVAEWNLGVEAIERGVVYDGIYLKLWIPIYIFAIISILEWIKRKKE